MSKIKRLKVSNGTVKVKISEISAPISITHADDFTKYSFSIFFIVFSGFYHFWLFYLNYYYHLFFKINFLKTKNKKKGINNYLFVLKDSFDNSVYIIALNSASLLLKPMREFPIEDFFSFPYYNSLFLMNLPLDVLCLISLIILRL